MERSTGDSLERHLAAWDTVMNNVCEEFADFGYMDDVDEGEEVAITIIFLYELQYLL